MVPENLRPSSTIYIGKSAGLAGLEIKLTIPRPWACPISDDRPSNCFCGRQGPSHRTLWNTVSPTNLACALKFPIEETQTYGALAKTAGNPKAVRAVGAPVGANPVSWFIPCHRAISADGRLDNYHWGVKRKRAMPDLRKGSRRLNSRLI